MDYTPRKRWVEAAFEANTDECLIWPFNRDSDGYARASIDGERRTCRLICTMKHGPPPMPGMEAAHSCGRGHEGCANPNHLRWATPRENQMDRALHGTLSVNNGSAHGMSKLTEVQAKKIKNTPRRLGSGSALARKYGVSPTTISEIRSGKMWKHI